MVIDYAPDSTTAWCITGFSVDPTYGLGIIKKPIEFNTKKAFYIVDHLPYSIKQDEVVVLQFTLFNNLGSDFYTTVQLINVQNQFEFVPTNSAGTQVLTIPQLRGTPVSFLVRAKKLGEMAVRLKATNMIDADAIEKVIRVMPKSLVHHISESRIFSKLSYSNETFIFPLNVNKYADEGSIKTSFIIERK